MECVAYSCELGERTFATAVRIKIPDTSQEVDRGFKDCCYSNTVLADLTSAEDFKNDFNGIYHQKQTSGETCLFILRDLSTNTDYNLNNSTYGDFKDFGFISNNPMLSTFIVRWKKVLTLLGESTYQLVKRVNIAGTDYDILSDTFQLRKFSFKVADKSVRIDSKHDGRMKRIGVDFKGSGFETSIRTIGFFGNAEPSYVQENLVFSNNEKAEQVYMRVDNKYVLQLNKVPHCITKEIFYFSMLGNEIFMNDYNLNNHSYDYVKYPVIVSDNQGSKFPVYSRDIQVNLSFEDRYKDIQNVNH